MELYVNENEITVAAIDSYVRTLKWLDFEISEYSGGKLVIHGSIDASSTPNISITFNQVFFVSLPFEWKTDTSQQVCGILAGQTARDWNLRYQVEHGFTLYFFKPEDFPDDFLCVIAAKAVSWKQLK
jgi:hypothetical protein